MMFENDVISIARLTSANDQESYGAPHLENLGCYIEPASAEAAFGIDEQNAYLVFSCIIDDQIDVQISDQVTDQHGVTYKVRGVSKYRDNVDVSNHTELLIVQKHDRD